ncbi:carboxymuconolactone decarboxylase family protein [Mycobacterium shigaense]|uniref:carboxymuconolactone decarboxylase family protein n=1 Tax=Mycobacterium shigaense TaxID=722731 RepID=UPI000E56D871|nr:carboxymuconolactone decarboxylase family protein [Mycobacterium shigaense]
MTNSMLNGLKTCLTATLVAVFLGVTPLTASSRAEPDPVPPPAPGGPTTDTPWLTAIQQRDPQVADSYTTMRERILRDGAIPAKYKFLMGMITDTIAAHPDGVKTLADNARATGATEAEITEAVEVGYLYGGTASLVMGANAFKGG